MKRTNKNQCPKDLNGNDYNLQLAVSTIMNKYGSDFDRPEQIYDYSDYLNRLYRDKGSIDSFFLGSADQEYITAFNALVIAKA